MSESGYDFVERDEHVKALESERKRQKLDEEKQERVLDEFDQELLLQDEIPAEISPRKSEILPQTTTQNEKRILDEFDQQLLLIQDETPPTRQPVSPPFVPTVSSPPKPVLPTITIPPKPVLPVISSHKPSFYHLPQQHFQPIPIQPMPIPTPQLPMQFYPNQHRISNSYGNNIPNNYNTPHLPIQRPTYQQPYLQPHFQQPQHYQQLQAPTQQPQPYQQQQLQPQTQLQQSHSKSEDPLVPKYEIEKEQEELLSLQNEQLRRQEEQKRIKEQFEEKARLQRILEEKQREQQLELERILKQTEQLQQQPSDPLAGISDLPKDLQFLAAVLGPAAFEEAKKKALAMASDYGGRTREEQAKAVHDNLKSSLENKDRSKNSDDGLTLRQKHFRSLVADEIVKIVAKYRKKGELQNKEEFKNLCKKFTLKVVESEIKKDGDLIINDKMITRMNTMVDKYFAKHGTTTKKS